MVCGPGLMVVPRSRLETFLRIRIKLIWICNAECLVRGGKKQLVLLSFTTFDIKKNQIVPESLGPNHSCSSVSFN